MNRILKATAALVLAIAATATSHAQNPNKPITLVVPFLPGGHGDVVGRDVASALGESLKQTVVVENVSGAGGVIAARKVLDAAPDGNTLILASPSQLILAGIVNRDVKFKSEDFKPIHMVGTSPYVIMARSDLPAKNSTELAELARDAAKKGAPLTYASVGVGTLNHVLGEDLARRIGAPLLHVPYKGGADVMRDLIGSRVDIFINIYTSQQLGLAEEGKFKFLAALSPARQPLLPKVPSVDEGGPLKGFYADIWTGIFVRKEVPEPVIVNLNQAMARVLSNPKVQATLMEHAGMKAAQARPVAADVLKEYAHGIDQFRDLAKIAGLAN